MYVDTDSIIFRHRSGDYMPPLGNYLGDLTSELRWDDWIVEFFSVGPKCYGYRTQSGKFCIKVKGHSINGETQDRFTFDNMLSILSDGSVENIRYSDVLRRVKKTLSIFQTDLTKQWRMTFDKRVIVDDDFNTLPYGY